MLKGDIVKRLKRDHPDYSLQDLQDVVDLVFEIMAEALKQGRRIEIRGFGSFSLHDQQGRTFVNPKTGKQTVCPPGKRIVFRPGRDLKKKL